MAYATLAQLKEYLGDTGTSDDALLTRLLDAATEAIESWTGRVFEASADTTRRFDADRAVDGRDLLLDEDLAQLTSVVNGDGEDVTSYVVLRPSTPPHSIITLRIDSGRGWTWKASPEEAISVTGRWAFSVSPPDDIVHATIRLAAYYYRQRDAQVFDVTSMPGQGVMVLPAGMPADVRVVLGRYRRFW